MDEPSKQAWTAFVESYEAYHRSLGDLRHFDMVVMLREALAWLPWRRQALTALVSSNVDITVQLLPELFDLALDDHPMLIDVRRCILRVPRDVLEDRLPQVVSAVVGDPASDYQAYRRLAELLDQLHFDRLLAELAEAAGRSADPDVREVADDFSA